uniref:uncharacterized protein LOC120328456 n=1 Tax=Styela clava TaxID=7725 RepID=UPI001939A691|nr:uncharacterized protein LOC120328456 [Styela clava]
MENEKYWIHVDQLRYTQNTINDQFKHSGAKLDDVVQQIKCNHMSVNDLPPMQVYEKDGRFYSCGNRRLYVCKSLRAEGRLNTVRVEYLGEHNQHLSNFTSKNDGQCVTVRKKI